MMQLWFVRKTFSLSRRL